MRTPLLLALLLPCLACNPDDGDSEDNRPPRDDTGNEPDTDTDADTDTDTDADADTDLSVVQLISALDGVDSNLAPFDAINSTVGCSGETWSVTMLDALALADQGWIVGWDLEQHVISPPQLMTFHAGSSTWQGSFSAAEMGLACDRQSSTVIYFLPVANNLLGKKAAIKIGTCTGTGFGTMGDDFLLNVATSTTLDAASARGLHMFTGEMIGPLEMNELSSDTWDLFFQWPGQELSTFAEEAMFGFVLEKNGGIVGVGGW